MTSVIILLMGGGMAVWQARQSVDKEIASSLNLAAQLIQLNARTPGTAVFDVSAWLPHFVSLEQTRHLQIRLEKPSGEVLKFTAGAKSLPNHDSPPAWFIHWVTRPYQELSQQLLNPDGERMTLIIRADPLDEITEAWKESRAFFISLLLMTTAIFLAINLVFAKALKALNVILDALKDMEQGNYQQKLPEFSIQEYDRIAKAVNHLTAVLDAANRRNRALTQHSLAIQEEERQRLARELHDELGQSLTAIKVMAVTIQKTPAETASISAAIADLCDHLITVVRSMMRNLHPLALTELGLKATLEDLLDYWSARHPELAWRLSCDGAVDELGQATAIQLFRVVQECLTNIVRHAKAKHVSVSLVMERLPANGGRLCLNITDDGQGCELDGQLNRFGLLSMRERIKSLGGAISFQSASGQGMAVQVTIPCP